MPTPKRTVRLVPAATAPAETIVPGPGFGVATRVYRRAALGGHIDVPIEDAVALCANGYAVLGLVGQIAARPTPADADWEPLPRHWTV